MKNNYLTGNQVEGSEAGDICFIAEYAALVSDIPEAFVVLKRDGSMDPVDNVTEAAILGLGCNKLGENLYESNVEASFGSSFSIYKSEWLVDLLSGLRNINVGSEMDEQCPGTFSTGDQLVINEILIELKHLHSEEKIYTCIMDEEDEDHDSYESDRIHIIRTPYYIINKGGIPDDRNDLLECYSMLGLTYMLWKIPMTLENFIRNHIMKTD